MIFMQIEIDGFIFKIQFGVFGGIMTIDHVDYSGVVVDSDSPIEDPRYIKALHEAFRRYEIIEKVIDAVEIYRHYRPYMLGDKLDHDRELIEFALSQDVISIEEHRQGLEDFLSDIYAIKSKKKKQGNYNNYLGSDHWKATRNKALERADYECWHCGGGDKLHVHHLTYERIGKELPTDLMVLCASCHARTHSQMEKSS